MPKLRLDVQAKPGTINNPLLQDNVVTTDKIAPETIVEQDIGPNAVGTSELKDDAVTKEKLNPDVTGGGLEQNVDGSLKIKVDNSTLELDGGVVKVKSGGITSDKLNINGSVDFNSNQLVEFRVENVLTDPAPGNIGRLIFSTSSKVLRVDNGTEFDTVGSGGGSGQFKKDLFIIPDPVSNTVNLTHFPVIDSMVVVWNGLVLSEGALNDYEVTGTTVTLNVDLTSGDKILVTYAY